MAEQAISIGNEKLIGIFAERLELRKSCHERRGKQKRKRMALVVRATKMTMTIWTMCDDSSTTINCSFVLLAMVPVNVADASGVLYVAPVLVKNPWP